MLRIRCFLTDYLRRRQFRVGSQCNFEGFSIGPRASKTLWGREGLIGLHSADIIGHRSVPMRCRLRGAAV